MEMTSGLCASTSKESSSSFGTRLRALKYMTVRLSLPAADIEFELSPNTVRLQVWNQAGAASGCM